MEPNEAVTLILKTTEIGDQSDKSIHLALAIVQAEAVIR